MRSHRTMPVDIYSTSMRVRSAEIVAHDADIVVFTAATADTLELFTNRRADPGLNPYLHDSMTQVGTESCKQGS